MKGAVAAAIAWFVGLVAPAPFSEYPYYAPLGAALATTGTVMQSVSDSFRSVAAVLVGAAFALAVAILPISSLLEVALAVGVSILCARWRIFGNKGDWVVMSAIFVLILGAAAGDGPEYIVSYAGLIFVGTMIGIGVNMVSPPLPLTPSQFALDRLRDGLAEQVEALAGWLEAKGPVDPDDWERRRRGLFPTIEEARTAVAQTRKATRANPRARRNQISVKSQLHRAAVLQTSAESVEEIVRLLVEWEGDGREAVALGEGLRPAFAVTLRAFGSALRCGERQETAHADGAAADAVSQFDASVDELRGVVRTARRTSEQDYFVVGALIVTLARAADALQSQRPVI